MKFNEVFNTAKKALFTNKVRSMLTMLGVIIGVCAVILLISIGRGLQNFITDQFAALGSNLIFVVPGRVSLSSDPDTAVGRNKLDDKHVDTLKTQSAEYISAISGYVTLGETLRYKTNSYYSSYYGFDENGFDIFTYELSEGRYFTKAEVKSNAKVVILGPNVAKELFANSNPIGKKIKSGDHTLTVIGVFKEKGQNFDDQSIAPVTTLKQLYNLRVYSGIVLKTPNTDEIDLAMRQFKRALLRDLKEDDFTVISQTDILGSIQDILGILTVGLGAIAGISLLVGGIGIMNIMLVSVTERTKEIGLRKALGATSNDIAWQFISESTMLSVGGGLIGILLGWGLSFAPRAYIRTEVTIFAVLLAFGFSVAVGIIFGTYPAMSAAKKDPIEALRYE